MDDALADWLRLREPADAAARSAALTRTIADAVPGHDVVRALDLATGTGSNLRYLAEKLPSPQTWLAIDRSATLLSCLPTRTSDWGAERGYTVVPTTSGCVVGGNRLDCRIETRQMDLGTLNESAIFAGRHLVTASALLDLVSERWLRALAAHCHAAGAVVLIALTYNGWSRCSPTDPEDEMIRDLLNRHQLRDKGLGGPAAGPSAATFAQKSFAEQGYHVELATSDWTLGSERRALQRQLIEGWAEAAVEMSPEAKTTIAGWRTRRLGHLDADRSHLVVGHHDLAAWLPKPRLPHFRRSG